VAEIDRLWPREAPAALSRDAATWLDELQLHVHLPRGQASDFETQRLGGGQ